MSDDGLISALARAQSKFPPIVKTHSNPAFRRSQYADVADVLAAVRPVLAAEGIALTQVTNDEDGVVLITTVQLGAEMIGSRFPLPVDGLTAQQVGSLMTYHRRYQLCALLGVHPVGDDDDGNVASTAPITTGKGIPASDKQAQYLEKLRSEVTPNELHWKTFCAAVLDGELPDHPSGMQTSKLIEALLAAKKKNEWPAGLGPSGYPADEEPF